MLKKSSAKPVGVASLADVQVGHRRAEFLLGIPHESEQLNGVGLEAALLILDFAFNRVGLNKLTSLVYLDNLAAQKTPLAWAFLKKRTSVCTSSMPALRSQVLN